MRPIAHLATNTMIISRLTPVSGYKSVFATTTAGIVHLQPVSPEKTQLYGGVVGKMYRIYTDGSLDILEGDRLRDTGTSKIYQVVNGGVTRRSYGATDYKSVIVQEVN